jgi:hypothetical protein
MSQDENKSKERTVPEFMGQLQDTAGIVLSRSGRHPGMLVLYWKSDKTYYTVDYCIEDPLFHRYMQTWENKDYALVCEVEERGEKCLMIEVWEDGRGIRKLIPFRMDGTKPVLDGREKITVLGRHRRAG